MPLQRLVFAAVLKADQEVRRDGLLDRNRRHGLGGLGRVSRVSRGDVCQGRIGRSDQLGNLIRGNAVLAHIAGDNVGGQLSEVRVSQVALHKFRCALPRIAMGRQVTSVSISPST